MIEQLLLDMISYYQGDPKRIQHFMKVHAFGKIISSQEHLDDKTTFIIEISCLLHDIGIKEAEFRNNSSAGYLQEQYGPALVKTMLKGYDISLEDVERISYLVGHHHTYTSIDGIDYQVLVEADFLVNLYEDPVSIAAMQTIKDSIFKTKTGLLLLNTMFFQEKKDI